MRNNTILIVLLLSAGIVSSITELVSPPSAATSSGNCSGSNCNLTGTTQFPNYFMHLNGSQRVSGNISFDNVTSFSAKIGQFKGNPNATFQIGEGTLWHSWVFDVEPGIAITPKNPPLANWARILLSASASDIVWQNTDAAPNSQYFQMIGQSGVSTMRILNDDGSTKFDNRLRFDHASGAVNTDAVFTGDSLVGGNVSANDLFFLSGDSIATWDDVNASIGSSTGVNYWVNNGNILTPNSTNANITNSSGFMLLNQTVKSWDDVNTTDYSHVAFTNKSNTFNNTQRFNTKINASEGYFTDNITIGRAGQVNITNMSMNVPERWALVGGSQLNITSSNTIELRAANSAALTIAGTRTTFWDNLTIGNPMLINTSSEGNITVGLNQGWCNQNKTGSNASDKYVSIQSRNCDGFWVDTHRVSDRGWWSNASYVLSTEYINNDTFDYWVFLSAEFTVAAPLDISYITIYLNERSIIISGIDVFNIGAADPSDFINNDAIAFPWLRGQKFSINTTLAGSGSVKLNNVQISTW